MAKLRFGERVAREATVMVGASAPHHTRGIKVRLTDGQIGRVQEIEPADGAEAPAQPGEGGTDAA